jgi:hypothetical protein
MKKVTFVVSTFIFLSGCLSQNLDNGPVEIWLDAQWDSEEQTAIIYGMERWEEETGINFFNFPGVYEDEDGEFSVEDDLYDERHVVYKLLAPSEDSIWLEENYFSSVPGENAGLWGYGFHSDIILFWYEFSMDADMSERDIYLVFLSNIATHESGHFLGMGHNVVDCDESMMAPMDCEQDGSYRPITDNDVDELCVFYDCPAR